MVKLIALYSKPQNPADFDAHYRDIHVPLVRKVPGLRRIELNRITGANDTWVAVQCYADFDGDWAVNPVLDLAAFQAAHAAQDPCADCDQDGIFNLAADQACFQSITCP